SDASSDTPVAIRRRARSRGGSGAPRLPLAFAGAHLYDAETGEHEPGAGGFFRESAKDGFVGVGAATEASGTTPATQGSRRCGQCRARAPLENGVGRTGRGAPRSSELRRSEDYSGPSSRPASCTRSHVGVVGLRYRDAVHDADPLLRGLDATQRAAVTSV